MWQLEQPPKKLLKPLNLLLRRDESEQHRQCCIMQALLSAAWFRHASAAILQHLRKL